MKTFMRALHGFGSQQLLASRYFLLCENKLLRVGFATLRSLSDVSHTPPTTPHYLYLDVKAGCQHRHEVKDKGQWDGEEKGGRERRGERVMDSN